MSNFRSIATVTETLKRRLASVAGTTDVPGATATAVRPTEASGGGLSGLPASGVNIYLYQVTTNHAFRNTDLPSRRGDGSLVQRPRIALDLHYLLTFYGDEALLEQQRVLGAVVQALHAKPLLSSAEINSTTTDVGVLENCDLAEEVERVKLRPLPLSLEELSKLWSVLLQIPYRLSIAYQASVVLIEGEEMPRAPLPVRTPALTVRPLRQPQLDSVEPQIAVAGTTLRLLGSQLAGDDTRVRFGDVDQAPASVADGQVTTGLPAELRPGIRTARVVHAVQVGSSTRDMVSNRVAFMLAPEITTPSPMAAAVAGDLELDVSPAVHEDDDVSLVVGEHTLALDWGAQAGDEENAHLVFALPPAVTPGTYLLRLRVNRAQSPLGVDEDGHYASPVAVVT